MIRFFWSVLQILGFLVTVGGAICLVLFGFIGALVAGQYLLAVVAAIAVAVWMAAGTRITFYCVVRADY